MDLIICKMVICFSQIYLISLIEIQEIDSQCCPKSKLVKI